MSVPPIFNYEQQPKPNPSKLLKAMALHQKTMHHGYSLERGEWSAKAALNVLRSVIPTSAIDYQSLQSISVAYLPQEARDIVYYLRANPTVFQNVASLSSQYPGNPPDWTARVQLKELQGPANAMPAPRQQPVDADIYRVFPKQQPERAIQSLVQTVQQNLPQAAPQPTPQQTNLPIQTLSWLALNPNAVMQMPLTDIQRGQLQALLNPTVMRLIEGLARSQQMMMSPDLIRILVSLLWNPQLHRPGGILPFDAFEKKVDEDEEESTPIDAVLETEDSMMSEMHEPHDPTEAAFQRIELSAQKIRDLCRHMKLSGGITLEEFQNYQPASKEEEELLRYLRQFSIFHAIADLNGRDETLDPSDIRIALHDHTLVLSDEHITLVFNP